MKRILIYYYNEEIEIDSTTSVTRLVASLIKSLEHNYIINYFSFKVPFQTQSSNAKPVFLEIPKLKKSA